MILGVPFFYSNSQSIILWNIKTDLNQMNDYLNEKSIQAIGEKSQTWTEIIEQFLCAAARFFQIQLAPLF